MQYNLEDRSERHDSPFLLPSFFLGGMRKGEINNQSTSQNPYLSAFRPVNLVVPIANSAEGYMS